MLFAVSKYQDTYRAKKKHSEENYAGRYENARSEWFNTEDEAKAFLQDRAWRGVQAAEKALATANKRLAKCRKKFSVSLQPLALGNTANEQTSP